MKPFTLTSALFAALVLSASGETSATLHTQIAQKEMELARIQSELTSLKSQLTCSGTTPITYKVQAGDTVSSIARRHKVTFNDLVKWNKLSNPSKIVVGDELVVGQAHAPASPQKETTSQKAPAKGDTYTVKNGDTFYRIAKRNAISVGKLKELNPSVNPGRITEGQKLVISGTPAPRVAHHSSTKKAKATQSKRTQTVSTQKKSTSRKKVSDQPTSSRKIANKKPSTTRKKEPAPTPPVIEEKVAIQKTVSSIILTDETTFSDFAKKHGTSTDQLNALNGWNLPKATVLARGSEIYVPQ